MSPSAEAAASRTSPFVTVKGDAHEDDDDDDEDEDDDDEGRASSGMLKRARRRLRGPGRWAVDDDAEDAKAKADEKSKPPNPAVNVDLVMFKIKCGKCAATLKIPAGVDVFRCPKCAAKLRVPVASGGARRGLRGKIREGEGEGAAGEDVARARGEGTVGGCQGDARRDRQAQDGTGEGGEAGGAGGVEGGARSTRGIFKVAGGRHRRDVQAGERQDGGGGGGVRGVRVVRKERLRS